MSDGGQPAQGPSADPRKSTTSAAAGPSPSEQKKVSAPGASTTWKETDKEFRSKVQADKKSFAEFGPMPSFGVQGPLNLGLSKIAPLAPTPLSIDVDALPESSTKKPGSIKKTCRHTLPEDDYIQCPHCGRKFAPEAAAKHIPQCKDFSFNKDEKTAFRKSQAKL